MLCCCRCPHRGRILRGIQYRHRVHDSLLEIHTSWSLGVRRECSCSWLKSAHNGSRSYPLVRWRQILRRAPHPVLGLSLNASTSTGGGGV